MTARVCSAVAVALTVACGGTSGHELVPTWKLSEAGGAPRVSSVVDLGSLQPPEAGALSTADSDGRFIVGELILIRGSEFGKQPTVTIGDRPAEVLGRTGNAGIVTRIPPGVPTGRVDVEVSHGAGRSKHSIDVRRYALVLAADRLHILSMAAGGALANSRSIDLPGARDVAVSADGQCAYVGIAGPQPALAVVSLTKANGPAVTLRVRLPTMDVQAVATAAGAPLAVVLGKKVVVPLLLTVAQVPSRYEAVDIDASAPGHRVAVSGDGKHIAVLARGSNELVVIDASKRPQFSQSRTRLKLDSRVPLLVDVAFSPRGKQLWVLAGDTKDSLLAGSQSTQLGFADLGAAGDGWRFVDVGKSRAPLSMAVATSENRQSATAIRSTAKRAIILIADMSRDALSAPSAAVGGVLSADLDGGATSVWDGAAAAAVAGHAAISFDLQHAVVAGVAAKTREYGAYVTKMSGGTPRYTKLGALPANVPLPRVAVMP